MAVLWVIARLLAGASKAALPFKADQAIISSALRGALAPDGRGGPSLKTSDLPSCAPWYELSSLVASA
ncbi:hypothetical protein INS49_009224 [Diaporthe citri]|uniref:uncharacterized protein n=1 Tax=Diaporthe citri TaxID=83186 RepID=UPI001C7FB04D|nr:uncharacterized protein INS49_009224 [Diaporthe citri]KAG6361005.1 hypothetical protein INS49_009224 [Diaporthe citri]